MASLLLSALLAGLPTAAHTQRPGVSALRGALALGAEDEALSLAQSSARRVASASVSASASASEGRGTSAGRSAGRTGREPLKAGWFDTFSQGESNYDMEADRSAQRSDGWEYKPDDPYKEGNVLKAAWYHESPSGGGREARQTHYPALAGGPAGRPESTGSWHIGQGGHWTQDYQLAKASGTGPARADWFESSLGQLDGFGRVKAPILGSPKLYEEGYQERAVNTTITCREAGCTAYTMLQAFNGNTETGRDCKLSLYLHPTDFDDQYSGERLTFIKVNGVTVNTDCFPMVSGCNASAQSPMFSCLQELPLDNIIDSTGFLNISAQISDVVDECPYQGNLLSGVPLVTCLVGGRPQLALPPPAQPAMPAIGTPPPDATYFFLQMPFRCPFRGCVANANFAVGPRTAKRISRCVLNMKVYQTDFDNEEGTNEAIEYIQVNGARVVSNLVPGKNPCRSQWVTGASLAAADREHLLFGALDVTGNATSGMVAVEAKITDHVDECAYDGYLLSGLAEMNCTLRPVLAAAPQAESNTSNSLASLLGLSADPVETARADAIAGAELPPDVRAAKKRPLPRSFLRDALLGKLRK